VTAEAAEPAEMAEMVVSEETVAIVALLHDICKVNVYKTSFRNVKKDGVWVSVPFYEFDDKMPYGHGEKSVYIINGYMRLTREEAFAIRFHMGFSKEEDGRTVSSAFEMYPLAMANYVADSEIKQSFNPVNPSKYLFYADLFNGFTDYTVAEGANARYASLANELHAVAKKSRKYGYVFDNAAKLCDVLSLKSEMGVLLRKAYKEGRRCDLELYAKRDIPEIIRRVELFARALEKQWMAENKPQGFDCQDIRLGGMLRRLEYCKRTLNDYLDLKINTIPELEEEILPFCAKGSSTCYNDAIRSMSTSALHVPGIY